MKRIAWAAAFAAAATMGCTASAEDKPGYTDTPMLPGGKWHVHDPERPYPEVVTPGEAPGAPPSDAIVLFDGTSLEAYGAPGNGCTFTFWISSQSSMS